VVKVPKFYHYHAHPKISALAKD